MKESGYAGFNLPIEIYLKNRDEPKKIRFNYDLHLQQSGPAIIKVQKEKFVFQSPSEEFRRKLLKGGGMVVTNPFSLHANVDQERNSRDSFTDEKPQQLIGKPKLGGDSSKKHKSKEHRSEDLPRPSNNFVNLFGPPIHKPSRISPNPEKPPVIPKVEKKEKEKSHSEKDKQKIKHDLKEKEYREEKPKQAKEDKEKSREEKRSKAHKERDAGKEKSSKRAAERPPSPAPPPKRAAPTPPPPSPSPTPSSKANSSLPKEELKPNKYSIDPVDNKNKMPAAKAPDTSLPKMEKKVKKDKKSHEKDRESKKEHKKEKEAKLVVPEIKETKIKEPVLVKEIPPIKEKPVVKPEKPFNKLALENFIKNPAETAKYPDGSKHKDKGDKERKHKHKKKDKKRDESRDKNKESGSKEKKHKTDKHLNKEKILIESKESPSVPEKVDPNTIPREIDKVTPLPKLFKEKDRSLLTISPISIDTSSQSSSKSASKTSKSSKNPLSSMLEELSSHSESDISVMSEDEDVTITLENNSRSAKLPSKPPTELLKIEPVKSIIPEIPKIEKPPIEKADKSGQGSSHKSTKKDKPNKHETKEEKKQRKRKSSSNVDDSENSSKSSKVATELIETGSKSKRSENSGLLETASRLKPEPSPRVKTDTKVQDDGVSSSLSDHPLKCDSPLSEDASQLERKQISPDYMIQLKELQHRIMTIQSNEELERVVNLIAETGKYEVTKKTFDFDLCLLDRSTVQQLQDLIGCESRA